MRMIWAATTRLLLAMTASIALWCGVWSAAADAQPFSPYSVFENMTQEELATLQVKLTYLGPQTRPVTTVAFTSPSNLVDVTLFEPFRRSGFEYINDEYIDDEYPPRTFSATVQELTALISNVGTLPDVTDGNVDDRGFLSFALLNTANNKTVAFEAIVNETTGRELTPQLMAALEENSEALGSLHSMVCSLGLLPLTTPPEVTADASVELSGVRQVRETGRFVGRVRVTNNGATTLATPLTLILGEKDNVRLVEEHGTTCRLAPSGGPYINLPVAPDGLPPGGTVEAIVHFENPDLEAIEIAPRLYSGPGSR